MAAQGEYGPSGRADLTGFLWLWLPSVASMLWGLGRAWSTGQADPWDWALPAASLMAAAGWLTARRGAAFSLWLPVWMAVGGAGMALIFCARASGRMPDGVAALGLLVVACLAACGGALLRRRHYLSGVPLLAGAALLPLFGPTGPVQPVPDRPTLAVITALPLFWAEAGEAGPSETGMGPVDAPIVTILRTRFTVKPLDDPAGLAESGTRRLLLAQPRALRPDQMVAIDRWVRDGGTAVILADPSLRWPSALPLGDRRRAPSITLLGPLLAHWGFSQAQGVEAKEIRHFLPNDGRLLALSGAQSFGRDGFVATRRIGAGRVVLLGDADVLDDRLWLGDPARPLDPRAWVADTPTVLIDWLNGAPIEARRWIRTAPDMGAALRWSLLVGTGWAIMGLMLFRRISVGFQAHAGPGEKRGETG